MGDGDAAQAGYGPPHAPLMPTSSGYMTPLSSVPRARNLRSSIGGGSVLGDPLPLAGGWRGAIG